MKKRIYCLALIIFLLAGLTGACAEPDLTLQDRKVYPSSWADAYTEILTDRAEDIRAYQDYISEVTSGPACRAVGLRDLTGDGIPELMFLELFHETEYGFNVGRFRIYTSDWKGVHCALTFQPEIDDMMFSRFCLAEDGLLTVWFSDSERGWVMQLRRKPDGSYAAETTLTAEEDFSGEGPDRYYRNGKKISEKKYLSLAAQIRAAEGTEIGSMQEHEGGYGFGYTPDEALEILSSGEKRSELWPGAGLPHIQKAGMFPELTLRPGAFTAGQRFDVYSAPSDRSWRGAKGKAAITSGSPIFVAGTEDGWILILYELESGVIRAGYIDSRKISGEYTSGDALSFSRTEAVLASAAVMTDDPIRQKETVARLKKGTKVTCLAEYRGWIYVEAKVSGKTARGFIAPSCIGIDGRD